MSVPYKQLPIHLGAPGEDISIKDLQVILKRFKSQNQLRLERAQDFLLPRQRMFLELLPIIFHYNNPLLPGFVSSNAPAGIVNYRPDSLAIKAAKHFSKSFSLSRQPSEPPPIEALFLMGSVGSIAFSKNSDMDIWLCHSSDLLPSQLADLQKKANTVEQWAATLDLEVHFFLMDSKRFRQGEDTPMSSESSGHSQHYLLLEEFYRTAIYIAGKSPAWWLVPPDQELNYTRYVDHLLTNRFIYEHEVIDFGGLDAVPAEEFTSVTLWHLYKALHAPHKSLLKLMLMECYASEYPNMQWLCQTIKQAVYEGSYVANDLDPYFLIYQKLENYLQQQYSSSRLDLLRQCFYLKIMGSSDTSMDVFNRTYRERYLQTIARRFHWSASTLNVGNTKNWDLSKACTEHALILQQLTHCYRIIVGFAREHKLPQQHNNDLKLLGRKLNAFWEKKPGKIEILTTRNEVHTKALELSLVASQFNDNHDGWSLILGHSGNTQDIQPLQKSRTLIELLCWMVVNGLYHKQLKLHFSAGTLKLSSEQLHTILLQLMTYLSEHFDNDPPLSAYQTTREPLHSLLFINLGQPAINDREDGGVLISTRSDAFSYGMDRQSLVLTSAVVALTSWGEINTSEHEGLTGLFDVLTDRINNSNHLSANSISVICQTPTRGKSIVLRIESVFSTLLKLFSGAENYRYLLAGGSGFYVFQNTGSILSYAYLADEDALFKELAKPQKKFRPSHFDQNILANTPIPLLYTLNKAGIIQVFYYQHNNDISVYIIDERGALYTQHHSNAQADRLLNHYAVFLDNVLNRNFFDTYLTIDYYQLHKSAIGVWYCNQAPLKALPSVNYLNLRITGETTPKGIVYTVYCNEHEFSSIDHGAHVFFAAYQYILSFRRSKEEYPVHISDIELPLSAFRIDSPEQLHTIHYLSYKQKIEDKFNH